MTEKRSTENHSPPTESKMAPEHIEHDKKVNDHEDFGNEKTIFENRDYAGAVAKSDPAEIKLVRKLDYRILPTLFIMYFLNYVDRKFLHSQDKHAPFLKHKTYMSPFSQETL